MTTIYRTKLFRSVLDCGCNLSLGDFAEEAQFEDVEHWLEERGYAVSRMEQGQSDGSMSKESASLA